MVETEQKIRVLLVDDHPIVLGGIRQFLATQAHIEIVSEASDGAEAVRKAKAMKPDVVLMDISMPGLNGIEATRILQKEAPGVKILILTMHDDREYINQFIECGAHGYLLKKTSPSELIQAIETVYHGESFFSPAVAAVFLNRMRRNMDSASAAKNTRLSEREEQVIKYIAQGFNTKDIADKLHASPRTISKYRERIMQKTGLHSIAELTQYAITHGIIIPKEED